MPATDFYKQQVARILSELGIEKMAADRQLFPEATELVSVGLDIYGRDQKLSPEAAVAWHDMKAAATRDKLSLLLVSAFRSLHYQK